MSQVIDLRTENLSPTDRVPDKTVASSTKGRGLIAWTVAACLLLATSGLLRAVQSSEYAKERSYLVNCPFPLNTIPRAIGDWQVVEGSEVVLDPLTTRISGSTDHILRTYVDKMTGVMLSVLVLFGPAEPVLPHTPQICYPSSGHKALADPVDRDIKISDAQTAKFRASIFAKPGGRVVIRNAVYHSFLLEQPWTPSIATQKFPRKNPGIFKIQIQRRIGDGESLGSDEPIEDFIQKLIPLLDGMIAAAGPGSETPAPTQPTS